MKQVVQWLLRIYRGLISPMLPHACRFVPTCSEYAMVAVDRHGAWRGSLLALWRLLRCHPFAKAGVDLVPPAVEGRGLNRAGRNSEGAGFSPGNRG